MVKGKKGQAAEHSWFSSFVSGLVKFFTIVFVLVIVGIGGFALYNNYVARGATVVAHTEAGVANTGIPFFASILGQETYNGIFRPDQVYGFESDIDKSLAQDVGIKDIKIDQVGRPDFGQPVEVLGRFTASSPLQDLELVVQCQLDEQTPVDAVVSATSSSGNTATVFKGAKETVTASCIFPEGINPEKTTFVRGVEHAGIIPTGLEKEKALPFEYPGTVKMFIRYKLPSKASHRTYLLAKNVVRQVLSKNPPVDVFTFFGVNDPQLTSDRKIKSIATPGPLNLGIGTFSSQPFVEDTPHPFAVSLTNNFGEWHGELKKLESLDLFIPPYMRLETDSDFASARTASSCAFVYDSDGDNGFRRYRLKDQVLETVNKECTKETLQSASLTEKECIDIFGKDRDKIFTCNFKFSDEFPRLKYDFIRAEAEYIYQTKEIAVTKAYRPLGLAPNAVA